MNVSQKQNIEQWREHIQPFLQSKLEEFHLLGLNRLTMDELWQFVEENLSKKKKEREVNKLHQFVNYVMSLSINDYMNKVRMDMFRGKDPLNSENPFN